MKARITNIPGPVFTINLRPPFTVKQLLDQSELSEPTHPTGSIQSKSGKVGLDYIVSKNELIVIVNRVYGSAPIPQEK